MSTATAPSLSPTAERFQDPIHGVAYSFVPDGDNLWVYSWMEDGGHLPEHFHPRQEERWEVLEGAVRLNLNGAWRDLVPADGPVIVERNMRHELRNTSGRQTSLRTEVLPAGRLVEFLTESARAAQEGLYNKRNMPTSWHGAKWIAAFAMRHREETVMCSPPPAVQRVVVPLVARFAK